MIQIYLLLLIKIILLAYCAFIIYLSIKKKETSQIICRIFVSLICIYFVLFQPITFNIVNGDSMNPTLFNGKTVISSRLLIKYGKIQRNDIVTFQQNNEILIKRVVGIPGDTVSSIDGEIYINEEQSTGYMYYKDTNTEDFTLTLQENEYFVLGDNRPTSIDSRELGIIIKDKIKTKLLFQ